MRLFSVVVVAMVYAMMMVNSLDFNYHSQEAIKMIFQNIVDTHPNLTYMHSIGQSAKGSDLWVIVIAENVSDHVTLRPHVKYVANMHGNEVVGREMLLHLAEYLVDNYGVNDTITNFLKTTVVHLMPTMNPDGFKIATEGDVDGITGRNNGNNKDLNRNFPERDKMNAYPIQPETEAVIKWLHQQQFVLSANLHGGSLVASYPYDEFRDAEDGPRSSISPDDSLFKQLSKTYSYTHHTMHLELKCSNDSDRMSFKDGITNGAKWYTIKGGMQDYNYMFAGCMEITLEISCVKYPLHKELPEFWMQNKEALIAYLMQAHMGVKGIVSDNNNNTVKNAEIRIWKRQSIFYNTTQHGEYWRLLEPGDYSILVTAKGYFHSVMKAFHVKPGEVTRLDVRLQLATGAGIKLSSEWTVRSTLAVLLVMMIMQI